MHRLRQTQVYPTAAARVPGLLQRGLGVHADVLQYLPDLCALGNERDQAHLTGVDAQADTGIRGLARRAAFGAAKPLRSHRKLQVGCQQPLQIPFGHATAHRQVFELVVADLADTEIGAVRVADVVLLP
jgi:hypothetical protein